MLSGRVASDKKPHRAGGESDDRADPERRPPAVMDHDVSDDQRRKAGARSHSGEDPSVGDAAFRSRNPASDELIGRGIDDRFAGAQKKTDRDKNE